MTFALTDFGIVAIPEMNQFLFLFPVLMLLESDQARVHLRKALMGGQPLSSIVAVMANAAMKPLIFPDACDLFTKTGFRPYDIAVTAALLIAKRNLRDQLVIHSDGADPQWCDAKQICQQALGYGECFAIIETPVKERWPDKSTTQTVLIRTLVEMHPPTLT